MITRETVKLLSAMFILMSILLNFAPVEAVDSSKDESPRIDHKSDKSQVNDIKTVEFTTNVHIENVADETSSEIKLKIPLISAVDSPYQSVKSEQFNIQPEEIKKDDISRKAVFNLEEIAANEEKTIEINYKMEIQPLTDGNRAGNDENEKSSDKWKSSDYNLEEEVMQAFKNAELAGLSDDSISGLQKNSWNETAESESNSVIDRADVLLHFVTDALEYDEDYLGEDLSPKEILEQGEGICQHYAYLYAHLLRNVGIPARVVNGYAQGSEFQLQNGQAIDLSGHRHSWVEFYHDELGWLPVDPTFYQRGYTDYFTGISQFTHIAQNYQDQPISGSYNNGELIIDWQEQITDFQKI